jgi:hypothetical protein
MTTLSVESRPWPLRRWLSAIAFVFAVQVALVFWLEDRSPLLPRKPSAAPAFHYDDKPAPELLELEDPTLFALPHRRGFSAKAWTDLPSPTSPSADWPEPPRFLTNTLQVWGALFQKFVETNAPPALPPVVTLEPQMATPEYFSIAPPPVPSHLRIEGALAGRPLLSAPDLPSWTNSDLLTNTIVQLLVDARGNPISAVLLRTGGSPSDQQKLADQKALDLAMDVRFQALRRENPAARRHPTEGLSVGTLVFEWQTILEALTNSP